MKQISESKASQIALTSEKWRDNSYLERKRRSFQKHNSTPLLVVFLTFIVES